MKAAVCYEFGQPLVIEEIKIDPPKTSEVKVKLSACAICHSDIHAMEGAWGGALPAVYGHEAAGTVSEVGADVKLVMPGDTVIVTLLRACGYCYFCTRGEPHLCEAAFALASETRLSDNKGRPVQQGVYVGAFAEYVVVHESQVMPVPAAMAADSASLLACGVITGVGAVMNTAQVAAGSSVVVIGCGGVGLNSIQGASLSGAHPLIAVDIVDGKLDVARSFGATHTVNSAQEDLKKAVHVSTGGRGADYVFVTVGSGPVMDAAMALLRPGGTLVVVGMPALGVKLQIEAANFAGYGQKVLGSRMGSTRLRTDIPKLVELYEAGRLKLDELVSGRYPLEAINEAITAVKQGQALRNVIVFD